MPTNVELLEQLAVKAVRTSDPLTEEDLQSAKKTRQAAHREFIRRRPGHYSRAWLANRLGVSVTTEQRYNQAIPITAVPTYTVTPIFWGNLNTIPAGFDIPGLFLRDEAGKRYAWKLDDTMKVQKTEVAVGNVTGQNIEVKGGLNAGDRIVTAGVHYLQPGQQVRELKVD